MHHDMSPLPFSNDKYLFYLPSGNSPRYCQTSPLRSVVHLARCLQLTTIQTQKCDPSGPTRATFFHSFFSSAETSCKKPWPKLSASAINPSRMDHAYSSH